MYHLSVENIEKLFGESKLLRCNIGKGKLYCRLEVLPL